MITRYLAIAALALGAALPARAQEKLPVVATFSILADFVQNVGGERIALSTLVGPNGDTHVYTPTPADAKTLAAAKLVFVNGLGFEGWMERLVKASGTKAAIVVASKGVTPLKAPARREHGHGHGHGHDNDSTDPHAWQNVANTKIYVANIRDALSAADPAGKSVYEANAAAYTVKLDGLEREVRETIATIPAARRSIITSHGAFRYFATAYGVDFIAPQGVNTHAEASARDVAKIIAQIKKQNIPAVFLENVTDQRLIRRIGAETGAKVGGTLYSDAVTDAKGEAPTYIDMIRHNVRQLVSALVS